MFERFVHAVWFGRLRTRSKSLVVWVSGCLMVWAVGPICGYSAHGVVEVQVILKNERGLFGNFGPGQADDVLRMSTVDRKRSSGNDWIAVILGVSPTMELESTLLATSSNLSTTVPCRSHLCNS
jgi:hypothetical protein